MQKKTTVTKISLSLKPDVVYFNQQGIQLSKFRVSMVNTSGCKEIWIRNLKFIYI